ncbi:MAG: hypothetical protein IPI91_20920 [Flavobacteriales bacterium]|nr:hypothetical protein [Flavobacteriales bacterium]
MIFVGARNFNYRVCTYSSPMSKKMTTPENDALFGYRIWQLRKKYGWERSLLAHHLGVPRVYLVDWSALNFRCTLKQLSGWRN